MKTPARQCSQVIDGPKVGRLVSWRRQCRNRTTDPSGKCPAHRGDFWYVGKSKSEDTP